MRQPEGVPDDIALGVHVAVRSDPLTDPAVAGILVGVVTGGILLVLSVPSDPQGVPHLPCALSYRRVLVGKQRRLALRVQLVGDRMSQSVPGVRIGDHPGTAGLVVAVTVSLLLRREDGPLTSERVTARIALPLRHPYRVFLLDPGRALVEGEVEPCCEQVLVERGAETRCDLRVVGGIVAVSGGERDPGRLGFEPDGAV